MAIENTPSKNVIVLNLEETVSSHTISAKTLNVNEDLHKNASNKPKNNTPQNVNAFPTDHIDAVDGNITIDNNFSIPNNIPDSIMDNCQLIDFSVSDSITSSNTSSNNNDALSNTTSIDIDNMLKQVRKINITYFLQINGTFKDIINTFHHKIRCKIKPII